MTDNQKKIVEILKAKEEVIKRTRETYESDEPTKRCFASLVALLAVTEMTDKLLREAGKEKLNRLEEIEKVVPAGEPK